MAKYNTFLLVDTKTRRPLLVTSSARKVTAELCKGRRVEVWNENERTAIIYSHQAYKMKPYIEVEWEYIKTKQMSAEVRNAKRGIMRM